MNTANNSSKTAKVGFIANLPGMTDVTHEYSVGNAISDDDIPEMNGGNANVFNAWTSDAAGICPCNPSGYKVEGDLRFYARWFNIDTRYATDAAVIENRDGGVYNLPQGGVIFYGASNFTRWASLESDMKPEIPALNHGIGGAVDSNLIINLNRLVIQYHPSVIVIQCSNNDIVKFSDDQCKSTKETLYENIHASLPDAVIAFVSHMPLPSRTAFWSTSTRLQELNGWMKSFCSTHEKCEYIDVWDTIYGITQVYLSGDTDKYFNDASHFNAAGQTAFCSALKPAVIKIMRKYSISK